MKQHNITDSKSARDLLETMGYEVFLNSLAQKVRSIFFIGQYHVHLSIILMVSGYFAEFAIMTDNESMLAQNEYRVELVASRLQSISFRSF